MGETKFEILTGKTIKNIILEYKNKDLKIFKLDFNLLKDREYINKLCNQDSLQGKGIEKVTFITETDKYIMEREQYIYLKEIEGNLSDIIDYKIIGAEEITNTYRSIDDSYTYTYYKIKTLKGYITFSWYGESDGYYTEKPYFYKKIIKKYNILEAFELAKQGKKIKHPLIEHGILEKCIENYKFEFFGFKLLDNFLTYEILENWELDE